MNTGTRPTHKAVRKGLAHLDAGRVDAAERLFRSVLKSEPNNPEANHALGTLEVRQGKPKSALSFLNAALRADPKQGQHWLSFAEALLLVGAAGEARGVLDRAAQQGFSNAEYAALRTRIDHAELYHHALEHHRAGRLAEAEKLYTAILVANPGHADSLHMIGVLASKTNRVDVGIQLIEQAIRIKGDAPLFYCSLGNALTQAARMPEAIRCFERALELQPGMTEALTDLGHVYQVLGNVGEAIRLYNAVIAGGMNVTVAHSNLATIYFDLRRFSDSVVHATAAVKHDPDLPEARNNLGNALLETGQIDEAIHHYQEAVRLRPNDVLAWNNIANALKVQGKITEAIASFRVAIKLDPGFFIAHSNLIMTLGYSAEVPHEALVAQARQFNDDVAAPLLRTRAFVNLPDPERRVRIGYVSADFRNHAVNHFFEPMIQHHRKDHFEFFAYANVHGEDEVTARLKPRFDHWRNICALSDDAAADLIEADGIDILVDMSGHTAGNRLMIFARKPAPVQATWLGFVMTTGVQAIDYRISDRYGDPPGMTEHFNTETIWRLPANTSCYQPRAGIADPIDHPPRDDNGYTTFGCFNNFTKVTDGTLKCWAEIMARVTDARLLLEILGIDSDEFRRGTEARLVRLGLPLDRVILEPRKPSNQYVLYNKIDIALDPFPFNGGTTTMDALWMGVPVVTLAGKYFVSRQGVTILSNAGLPEMIADDEAAYIDLATGLATDPSRLRAVRHGLRQKVKDSRMMDHAALAADIEAAYRGMWRTWCADQSAAKA